MNQLVKYHEIMLVDYQFVHVNIIISQCICGGKAQDKVKKQVKDKENNPKRKKPSKHELQ